MKIAFSPCPNDTFIFHAWVHGLIPDAPKLNVSYRDIHITNQWAQKKDGPDILKVSCAVLPYLSDEYTLLPCGGALGNGCGPLVLVKDKEMTEESLFGKTIGIPSMHSTAYLLFRLWAKSFLGDDITIRTLPFEQIMPSVRDGVIDAGLVIHEARFTFHHYHLHSLIDLGEWWEEMTQLPIPLGAIVARRFLDTTKIADYIRSSLTYAWTYPDKSKKYILSHAQEMDKDVIASHIHLYVNHYTQNLHEIGYKAISTLLQAASKEKIIPEKNFSTLYHD